MSTSDTALQFAAQAWCQETTSNKTFDSDMAKGVAEVIQPLLDELELAWGIIANSSGGDWTKEVPDWVVAAENGGIVGTCYLTLKLGNTKSYLKSIFLVCSQG